MTLTELNRETQEAGAFEHTLAAIEKTPKADSAVNPQTQTP